MSNQLLDDYNSQMRETIYLLQQKERLLNKLSSDVNNLDRDLPNFAGRNLN